MRNPSRNQPSAMVSVGKRMWKPMFSPNWARARKTGSSMRRIVGRLELGMAESLPVPPGDPEVAPPGGDTPQRGKLKIFFGAFPGVGKTYAMLVAGRRMLDSGRDVIVGVIDTHEDPESEAMLEHFE